MVPVVWCVHLGRLADALVQGLAMVDMGLALSMDGSHFGCRFSVLLWLSGLLAVPNEILEILYGRHHEGNQKVV